MTASEPTCPILLPQSYHFLYICHLFIKKNKWKSNYLCELVWQRHDLSWHVTKCHHVKWKDFWWFNFVRFDSHRKLQNMSSKNHQRSPKSVMKRHEVEITRDHKKSFNLTWWHFTRFDDIWEHLMTFDDFSWKNRVVCHDMSCLSNQFAEVILFQIMARSYVKLSEFFKNCGMNTLCHMIKGSGTLSILKCP